MTLPKRIVFALLSIDLSASRDLALRRRGSIPLRPRVTAGKDGDEKDDA